MINTAVGECGISMDGQELKLRPSFFALSKLLETHGRIEGLYLRAQSSGVSGLICCIDIIKACASDESLVARLVGIPSHRDSSGRLKFVYRPGAMPVSDIRIIAMSLMRYGVEGKPHPHMKKSDARSNEDFNPVAIVGFAVAELGLSLKDAWDMTMVEFQRSIEAKHPSLLEDVSKYPSKDEYNALMKMVSSGVGE